MIACTDRHFTARRNVGTSSIGRHLASKTHARSRERAHGVRLLVVVLPEGAEGLAEQLHVAHGVVALHGLVEVGVEGHLLHVLLLAELHKALAGRVGGVEEPLQRVEHEVRGPVLGVPLADVLSEVALLDHAGAGLGALRDGLCAHAAALGRKVDALAGALGHVARGVADERRAAARAPGPRVLRDGVRLHAQDLAALDAGRSAVADALLVPLDALLVHDGARAHGHVVALGEDPGVEVRGDVLAHVHLRALLVVLHLRVVDAHALLEGDGVLVLAGPDVLGHAAVGAVPAHDDVHLQRLLRALARAALLLREVVVGEDVGVVLALGQRHAQEQAVDDRSAVLGSAVPQEGVQDLAPEHADELVVLERLADLHLLVRGRDHGHLADPAVHDVWRKVELLDHAERDGAAAGLAVVQLALDEEGLDARARQGVGAGGAAGAAPDDRHAELPALGQLAARAEDDPGLGELAPPHCTGRGRCPAARQRGCTSPARGGHRGRRSHGRSRREGPAL
mmetsp:Transcript_47301/g.146472  ORF Transcript_47301/g.146472 Transcript_47301/m.146472 type:complete len:510 (+) Transcript_47301:401-1930(+)